MSQKSSSRAQKNTREMIFVGYENETLEKNGPRGGGGEETDGVNVYNV